MKINSLLTPGMVLILIIAGLSHFIFPQAFTKAVPIWLLAPKLIVYLTGLMELLLAVGLMRKSSRGSAAELLIIYFIVILPAHIYVSLNGIEMFGVSHKGLLWLRTFGQGFFIWWAYLIRREES